MKKNMDTTPQVNDDLNTSTDSSASSRGTCPNADELELVNLNEGICLYISVYILLWVKQYFSLGLFLDANKWQWEN